MFSLEPEEGSHFSPLLPEPYSYYFHKFLIVRKVEKMYFFQAHSLFNLYFKLRACVKINMDTTT